MASDPVSKKNWDKQNTTPLLIKFQNKTDQDIIDYLEEASIEKGTTRQVIIKAALREYMRNHEMEGEN